MKPPVYSDDQVTLYKGDARATLAELPAESVDCIVTSPPYFGLRDYGVEGQYGLEDSPAAYVETMRAVFAEARRVLANDGTLWLNLGDSYSGSWGNQSRTESSPGLVPATDGRFPAQTRTGAIRPGQPPAKNLMGMPWRVAFALQDDGWTLRNAIVWHKPNAMPESVTDRLSCDYEHVFLFSRSRRYWFDLDPIREPLAYPAAADGSRVFGGANKAGDDAYVDAAGRRRGATYGTRPDPTPYAPGMTPQRARAVTGQRHTTGRTGDGRNPGSVWDLPTQPFPAAHFAVMPAALAERCILAGCKPGGIVLDPFSGSGTTGMAATKLGRRYVGIDLNGDYLDLSLRTRLAQSALCDAPQDDGVVA